MLATDRPTSAPIVAASQTTAVAGASPRRGPAQSSVPVDSRLRLPDRPVRCPPPLASGSGDAVDLEIVAALEVTDGGLRARPVTAIDGEVVAEGDQGDLQLRDTVAGRLGKDVAGRFRVAARTAPG